MLKRNKDINLNLNVVFKCAIPNFTVLSANRGVLDLFVQAVLSTINSTGGRVTEGLGNALHGSHLPVVNHPRGAGLDVAPLHAGLLLTP